MFLDPDPNAVLLYSAQLDRMIRLQVFAEQFIARSEMQVITGAITPDRLDACIKFVEAMHDVLQLIECASQLRNMHDAADYNRTHSREN